MADKEVSTTVETVDDDHKLELKTPMADGTKTLVFDENLVNGRTLIKCATLAKKEDPTMMIPSMSTVYQAHVAAAMTKKRYDEICNLSMRDFTAVTTKTLGFLTSTGE